MYPSYEEIRGEMQIRGLEGLIPDVYVCALSTSVNEFRSLRFRQAHYKNHRTILNKSSDDRRPSHDDVRIRSLRRRSKCSPISKQAVAAMATLIDCERRYEVPFASYYTSRFWLTAYAVKGGGMRFAFPPYGRA